MVEEKHVKSGEHVNNRIENLEEIKEKVFTHLTKDEAEVLALIDKSKQAKQKIQDLHEKMISHMEEAEKRIEKDVSDSEKTYKTFGTKYCQLKKINALFKELKREVDFLEHELKELMEKEQELKYHDPEMAKGESADLKTKFAEVSRQLETFENGLVDLNELERTFFEKK